MVLSIERSGSLTDLRRTQRRVYALLMSDTHADLQKYKLRKQTLPKTMCYVCSRIDPGGIFRKPNHSLYEKGFFTSCEHLKEHLAKQDNGDLIAEFAAKRSETEVTGSRNRAEFTTTRTDTISVTIRRGSRSTKHPSPLKREGTFGSDLSKLGNSQRTPAVSLLQREISDHSSRNLNLPPIVLDKGGRISESSLTKTAKRSSFVKTQSPAITRLSRNSTFLSETLAAGSETESISNERIMIIPTGLGRNSAISGLSSFTEGTTPTKSTNDLDSKFLSEEEMTLPGKRSITTMPSKGTTLPTQRSGAQLFDKNTSTTWTGRHTNTSSKLTVSGSEPSTVMGISNKQSDQIQDTLRPGPLVREAAMIEEPRDPVSRPKAGHQRERVLQRSQNVMSEQTESSYRSYQDHLTDPESDYPQRFSDQNMEKVTFDLGSYSESCSSKDVSEDASIVFSAKTAESRHPSERRSVCRCTSSRRELSLSRNICKTCGKTRILGSSTNRDNESEQKYSGADSDTRASSSTRCLSTRQQMLQHDERKIELRSKTFISEDYVSRSNMKSKLSADEDYMTKMYMQSKLSADDDNITRMYIRSKQATDEDYMDLDSIIYEDDGRYWSSGEESSSPVPHFRHTHAHPYPLVNPDIHKVVYIKALKAARAKGKKNIEDLDDMLRRPNVFSYLPLLPESNRNEPNRIGLRPEDSKMPKRGQYMKHIFGDFRPDDFYKGEKTQKRADIILDYSSNDSSTEKMTSADSPITEI